MKTINDLPLAPTPLNLGTEIETQGVGGGDSGKTTLQDIVDVVPVLNPDNFVGVAGDTMTGNLVMNGTTGLAEVILTGAPHLFDELVAGTSTDGSSILLKDETGVQIGALVPMVPDATRPTNYELGLGSITGNGVRLFGAYTYIETDSVAMGIAGAELGSRLVASGFTSTGDPILSWEDPPAPSYSISCTNATDFPIYTGSGTGPWVEVCLVTTTVEITETVIDFFMSIMVHNASSRAGSLEFGIGTNGLEPTSVIAEFFIGPSDDRVISFSSREDNLATLPIGETFSFYVRANGIHAQFELGATGTITPATFDVVVQSQVTGGGGGIPEAPNDTKPYVRQSELWADGTLIFANIVHGHTSLTGTQLIGYAEAGGTFSAGTIDLSAGNAWTKILGSNVTFVFSNPPTICSFTLLLTNGGTYAVTWPASLQGTAPNLTALDLLSFFTFDGGTKWYWTGGAIA